MRYWAYLSYAHADERHARRLHRRIESFRVPKSLRGTSVAGMAVGDRLRPLFRDRDELSSSGDLKTSLEAALSASTALIVLCSPTAAGSRWVNQEIETFVAVHGARRVFPLIIDGEPNSGDERECFPPALRGEGAAGLEPIAGDLRPHADGRRDGALKVIAGLLDVGFDAIKQRDAQRRHRTAIGIAAGASLIAAVTTIMAVYALHQRDIAQLRRAQAEDLIGFMLGDLRTRLREVGRLDVLDAVGDQAEDYFAALPPTEINDHALEKQALALRQIGEVRLQQGRHENAQRAFETSLAQLEELAARKPGETGVLFERSQAEFWAGAAHYRALSLERARDYFQRYTDTAAELVALEPGSADYRMEQGYALSNLGTLAVDQGDLDVAERAFARSGRIFSALADEYPDDPGFRFESAASESWRARVREARFDWSGAIEFRRAAAQQHAEVSALTGHPFHRRIEAEAWIKLAVCEFALGRSDAARAAQSRAIALYDALAEGDPDNLEWRLHWLKARLRQILLAHFSGNGGFEPANGQQAFDEIIQISAGDPENALWSAQAVSAGLDLAKVHLLAENVEKAVAYLRQIGPLARANLEAAPDDAVSARQFYEFSILEHLAGIGHADDARARLTEQPLQVRANLHLAALLERLAGNFEAAGKLDREVRQAGFESPEYLALQAMVRR